MAKIIDWDRHIGRRLTLRDLHVLFTVVQWGSMAKAANHLRVSQPAVSKVIAELEHTVGAKLLDRSPRGVEPTAYGRALLKRGRAAFDELRQGIRDLEFLADPTAGELKIAAPESVAAAILPPIIERFARQYPRVVLHVDQMVTPTLEFTELRERKLDLVLARLIKPAAEEDDLDVEILLEDEILVVTGMRSAWARRRKIDLADLVDAPWIVTPPGTVGHAVLSELFRTRHLAMPKTTLITYSVQLRTHLVATGEFITVVPRSVLRLNAERFSLKVLPIKLPVRPWPIAIVTLKNRTLSPVVQLFIENARAITKSLHPSSSRAQLPSAGSASGAGQRLGQSVSAITQRFYR
jgi:DNA-binding transcriptional LysR family regulator